MSLRDFLYGFFVVFPKNVNKAFKEQLVPVTIVLIISLVINLFYWLGV